MLSHTDCACRFLNSSPMGYGYHTDFFNGWEPSILQRTINECHCSSPYGDPSCCVASGMFTIDQNARCFISNIIDEITAGNLSKLSGANPIQVPCYMEYTVTYIPAIMGLVYVSIEEGVVLSGMTEVLVSARTVSGRRKVNGKCLWMESARSKRVPEVVLMVGVLMTIIGLV
ncbi:hypothetical protein IW262DRAFT_1281075 [Armillaria fumosa]|nr:hypothetical protein IW262DRAFT_1281075 [Armillaria fumosa]